MRGMGSIWSMIKSIGPFAIIAGYVGMYATTSKGVASIIPDLQAISLARIQANWQNFVIAGIGAVGLVMLHKFKMPVWLKSMATIGLYFLIGWQLAQAIDPPAGASAASASATARYQAPAQLNPYSYAQ